MVLPFDYHPENVTVAGDVTETLETPPAPDLGEQPAPVDPSPPHFNFDEAPTLRELLAKVTTLAGQDGYDTLAREASEALSALEAVDPGPAEELAAFGQSVLELAPATATTPEAPPAPDLGEQPAPVAHLDDEAPPNA
jgi:hypothetical protein